MQFVSATHRFLIGESTELSIKRSTVEQKPPASKFPPGWGGGGTGLTIMGWHFQQSSRQSY